MPKATFTTVINSLWNMYMVVDPGGLPTVRPEVVPSPWGDNGLAGLSSQSQATISTGTSYGPVRVTFEQQDEEPPLELEQWTDVVELPFLVVSGRVVFTDWNGQPFHEATVRPGPYRLRIHVRGRDEGNACQYELTMADDPPEEYLIQLFRGDGGEVVYKAEDMTGGYRRGDIVPEPLPRGRDRLPQAEFEEYERSRDIILGLTAEMSLPAQRLIIELIGEQIAAQLPVYDQQPPEPEPAPSEPVPPLDMDAIIAQALAAMPPELRALTDNPGVANLHREIVREPSEEAPDTRPPQ
jgi:hypothetical protein